MNRLLLCLYLIGALLSGSCIDRYVPEVPASAQANLVVDGFINSQGSTVIKLSRTFSLNTKRPAPVETRAQIAIVDDAGRRYPLAENPAGTYTSASHVLDAGRQYQLRLTTAPGHAYASDLTPVVPTPAIDTLTWLLTPQQGIQIFLSTRAPGNASRYYRWEYAETWQFRAPFPSPGSGAPATCWRTTSSVAILQGNTTRLGENALVDFPLLTVLPSIKLRFGYSLLVRQVGQTQAEYDYWERLRKNTENLGTVNDPLPGRVTGNVHALADAAEPVLGYVGAHSVTQKRFFIFSPQFPTPRPESVFFDPDFANCTGPTPGCTDCRVRGTSVKPSFWP